VQETDFVRFRDKALRNAVISTFLLVVAFVFNLNQDHSFLITAAALGHVFLIASLGFQKGKFIPVQLTEDQNKDPKLLVAVLAPAALYLLINLILFFQ